MDHQQIQFHTHRERFSNQIRRQNRQQILEKRRHLQPSQSSQQFDKKNKEKQYVIDQRFEEKIKQYHAAKIQKFMTYLTAINDPDILKQHYGIIGVRKLLSIQNNPFVQNVIDAGLIPKLIAYAKQTSYPQLQLQSVWCLANVAAGNSMQTNSIIDKGGIKIFVDLLLSEHIGIIEQAIWVVGNIACDTVNHRDMLIKAGGHKNLIRTIERSIPQLSKNQQLQRIIETAIWSLSAICRTKPIPSYSIIKEVIQQFFYVIKNQMIKDFSILSNVCWALSYYTYNEVDEQHKQADKTQTDKIQNCINYSVIPKILQYLDNTNDQIALPCLKIIANIATGNDQQKTYLIQLGIVDKLQQLLYSKKKMYRKQACWALSNFAHSSIIIQQLFSRQILVRKLIQLLNQDLPDVKSQICYIFANAIDEGDPNNMYCFVNQIGFLKHLSLLLSKAEDVGLIDAGLDCLQSVLQLGIKIHHNKNNNYFVKELYKLQMIPKLQEFQYHKNQCIYNKIIIIINSYFEHEDPLKIQHYDKNMI